MPLVCRICLRTGFERNKDVDETLSDFHDELCDYDVFVNSTFTICPVCEYQLIKFYNFKQKCRRAHRILKSKRSELRKNGVLDLRGLMPPDSIGFSTAQDRQGIYSIFYVPEITYDNQSSDQALIACNDIEPTEPIDLPETDQLILETNDQPKDEKLTTDLIKTEVEMDETISEMPVLFIEDMKTIENDTLDFKQELDCSEDVDLNTVKGMLEDFLDSDDDDEKPLAKSVKLTEPTDKQTLLSVTDLLDDLPDDINYKKQSSKRKKKALLSKEISLEDLKFLSKTLPKSDRPFIKVQQGILELKQHVLSLIEQGKIDLGENVTITKESFLDMFAKCDKTLLKKRGIIKKGPRYADKVKKFLLFLLKKYNPEYETVFHMEYLPSRAMKLAEFQARKETKEYVEALFKCDICYKAFDLQSLLDYHMKWHDASRAHACDICSMRFTRRKHLNVHARSNHYSVYRCKLCKVHTYNFDVMVNHYNQHKGVKYTCDVCLGEYSKSCLNTHRLTHATHTCPMCARSFVSKTGLNNHVKLKHQGAVSSEAESPQRVPCEQCDATFKSREILYRHRKIIHSRHNTLFKCRYAGCLLNFSSAAELRQHCAACGHTRRCPPDGRRRWACARVRARVNVTGPDKEYRTCPICQEKVANKFCTALYKHHLARHPSEPYAGADARAVLCEHCGKSFVHRSVYRDHLNVHTGAKPYVCRECGARFPMRRALYVHRDQHGPPRHQCKDCGKMFRTGANLFSHRRMHIGDRRFKCNICFKGFLHAGSLKEHINGVHNQIRRVKKTK